MKKTLAGFFALLLIASGCLDEPDCYLLNNNVVGIAFKKLTEPNADTALNVTAFGTVEPPLLFWLGEPPAPEPDTSFTRLTLPLRYFNDETTFFFEEPD